MWRLILTGDYWFCNWAMASRWEHVGAILQLRSRTYFTPCTHFKIIARCTTISSHCGIAVKMKMVRNRLARQLVTRARDQRAAILRNFGNLLRFISAITNCRNISKMQLPSTEMGVFNLNGMERYCLGWKWNIRDT